MAYRIIPVTFVVSSFVLDGDQWRLALGGWRAVCVAGEAAGSSSPTFARRKQAVRYTAVRGRVQK